MYEKPTIRDYGDLTALTAFTTPEAMTVKSSKMG